jgi:hypothetical protein
MGKFRVLVYEDIREEGKTILKEKADLFFAERLEDLKRVVSSRRLGR